MEIRWEKCIRKNTICSYCKNEIVKGTSMISIKYRGYRQSSSDYFCEPHLNEYIEALKLKKILGE